MSLSTVVGIDPSLNSTGVAYRANGTIQAFCIEAPGRAKKRGFPRIRAIREVVDQLLADVAPRLVVFEGYAMHYGRKSNTSSLLDLAELGGVLKMLILENGIDILLVPPTSLKLYITGRGTADKQMVSEAVKSIASVSFSSSDQYDAAALLLMGEAYNFRRRTQAQQTRRILPHREKALDGCVLLPSLF